MAHVEIGQIGDTGTWRITRNGVAWTRKGKARAMALAKRLGGRIVETIYAAHTPVDAPEPDAPGADLSVLDLSIANLTRALASGDYDDHLDALAKAEQQGKTRTGALAAIADRQAR